MSDKDLIRRGDVRRGIAKFISDNNALIDRWAAVIIEAIMAIIDDVPTVSQEMTEEEFQDIESRMFHEDFDAWLKYSDYVTGGREEEAVAFAKEWAREHPEERSENDE